MTDSVTRWLAERPAGTQKPPARGFEQSEFKSRVSRAQSLMSTEQIDVLLLMTEPEVRYFTGFLTPFWQSPTRPWFVLVPSFGEPVAVIPAIGHSAMQRAGISDIRTWSSPHESDDGISLLVDTITELSGDGCCIGLPMGRESSLRMPLSDFNRVTSLLPRAQLKDCSSLMQSLRQVKSVAEIEKIQFTCQTISTVFDTLPELLSIGMSVTEVFRLFKLLALHYGVDDISYLVGTSDAGGYDDIISAPGSRPLTEGDVLILDTGSVFDGYFCDFDRNFAVGHSTPEVASMHALLWDATEAGLECARPGITCADLFHAMNDVLSPVAISGSADVGRMGHGLGMQLTENPSLVAFDKTELVPGMVLTLEPGVTWAPGRMMVHEENIVITDTGARLLTKRAPRTIPVI